MSQDIATLQHYLTSENKLTRLKALKLILKHPDATAIQLVRCLCSEDNRNFEFLEVFDLGPAMRGSWKRLHGVTDDTVYEYLAAFYADNRIKNASLVVHILELLCTRQALDMLVELKVSWPATSRFSIDRAYTSVSENLLRSRP